TGWRSLHPTGGWIIVPIGHYPSKRVVVIDRATPTGNNVSCVVPHIDRFQRLVRPINCTRGGVDFVWVIPREQIALSAPRLVEAWVASKGIRPQRCTAIPV